MKVAHIVCDLMAGGGQKSTIDLIRATAQNVQNYLILLEDKKSYELDDIEVVSLCPDRKKYKKLDIVGDMLLAGKLRQTLDALEIDIAISHMEVTAKVLRFVDIPKIYYMRVDISHELEVLKEKSRFRYFKRKMLYKQIFTDQVLFCISEDTKTNIAKQIRTKDIQTFYNPFDFAQIERFASEPVDFHETDYIIQIGSGFSRKRQDVLLKAFAKIANNTLKLLLLGTEPYREALDLMEDLNIDPERVLFHPFVENPYPYIKHARLLVISSEREGLPRVMVEALSLGIPVVSTDCDTGPREILTGELSRYLAEVNNPDDLAAKMECALAGYPGNLHRFLVKFDKHMIASRYIHYLKDYLKTKGNK